MSLAPAPGICPLAPASLVPMTAWNVTRTPSAHGVQQLVEMVASIVEAKDGVPYTLEDFVIANTPKPLKGGSARVTSGKGAYS
eukprot:7292858-Pyramimonas_sp.AAC.1